MMTSPMKKTKAPRGVKGDHSENVWLLGLGTEVWQILLGTHGLTGPDFVGPHYDERPEGLQHNPPHGVNRAGQTYGEGVTGRRNKDRGTPGNPFLTGCTAQQGLQFPGMIEPCVRKHTFVPGGASAAMPGPGTVSV